MELDLEIWQRITYAIAIELAIAAVVIVAWLLWRLRTEPQRPRTEPLLSAQRHYEQLVRAGGGTLGAELSALGIVSQEHNRDPYDVGADIGLFNVYTWNPAGQPHGDRPTDTEK